MLYNEMRERMTLYVCGLVEFGLHPRANGRGDLVYNYKGYFNIKLLSYFICVYYHYAMLYMDILLQHSSLILVYNLNCLVLKVMHLLKLAKMSHKLISA